MTKMYIVDTLFHLFEGIGDGIFFHALPHARKNVSASMNSVFSVIG